MVFLLLCFIPLVAAWGITDMIGSGRWIVKKISKCSDDDKYSTRVEITSRKVNRTHDGINAHISDFELNYSHGIFIDACKYMDGGCKPYQTFADDCACCFLKKYAAALLLELLTKAGIDPPDCPIPKGRLDLVDYVVNYDALAEKGIYGTFDAKVYLLHPKEKNAPAKRLACMHLTLHFDKKD